MCDRCQSGANTSSKPKTYLTPGRIDKWEDFDYESLRSMYGGARHRVLKQEFSCKDFSTIPRIPFREPSHENSLETLLSIWNQSVISEALSVAQPCLYKPSAGNTIYMAKSGQAYFAESPRYRPDWAGNQPRPSQPQVANADRVRLYLSLPAHRSTAETLCAVWISLLDTYWQLASSVHTFCETQVNIC